MVKNLKERIKELRKTFGLTQQKFADRLGLKRQTIAAYEIGNIEPSESTLLLICKEFNVNEDWLRTGDGEMKSKATIIFGDICADIGVNDPKAKEAIMKYYELSDADKQLWWAWMERFIR